jgi:DNA-binding CsgD family transcriptional regulator
MGKKRRSVDLVGIVETAYRVELPERDWLAQTLDALTPAIEQGRGVTAFAYDASNVRALRVGSLVGTQAQNEVAIRRSIEQTTPDRVRWTFRTNACQLASAGPGWKEQPAYAAIRELGFEDVLFLNALDPSGRGCLFTARLARRGSITAAERRTLARVAAHLGAAYRLHRRLHAAEHARPEAPAVVAPSGRLLHAEGDAKLDRNREALRRAVLAMERARGPLRRVDAPAAVEGWRGLVGARWSLVDRFERDGKRYIVAEDNAPQATRPVRLSERERQVVAYAAMGHSNKLIAYELGISASTVGVLLHRAAAKLGVKTRGELAAAYAKLAR